MRQPDSFLIVIFGASGDLTKRMIMPGLFHLFRKKLLPEKFTVVGVSRTRYTDEEFRSLLADGIKQFAVKDTVTEEAVAQFCQKLYYFPLDYTQADDYQALKDRLQQLTTTQGTSKNYIFYLSTPPKLFDVIATHLGYQGLQQEQDGWRRIVIEKPFGYDLGSARALNKNLLRVFQENQIYRIDHYLGKETVQNLLVLRFANGIFEPLWNRRYIQHVEITSAEALGVESRGGYFDSSGILRDMVQNHLLQIVGLVAMEPPSLIESNAVRNETLKVFQALRKVKAEELARYVVRGQYTASAIHGEQVKGYREEASVAPDSRTETFVALKFYIDNWRWAGVPFYIRAGKRMPTKITEVVISYKAPPLALFSRGETDFAMKQCVSGEARCVGCRRPPGEACAGSHMYDASGVGYNQLIMRIQPDEGILLKFNMKVPGRGFQTQRVHMNFSYKDLTDAYLPTAYERLLLDCMNGDATLFARADAVETCWDFITPILETWAQSPSIPMFGYPAGSWGPQEANALFDANDIPWRYPCKNLTCDRMYFE